MAMMDCVFIVCLMIFVCLLWHMHHKKNLRIAMQSIITDLDQPLHLDINDGYMTIECVLYHEHPKSK